MDSIAESISYEPSDVLWDVIPKGAAIQETEAQVEWDVFLSHASEDKEAFVRPLAEGLTARGVKVWFRKASWRGIRRTTPVSARGGGFGRAIGGEPRKEAGRRDQQRSSALPPGSAEAAVVRLFAAALSRESIETAERLIASGMLTDTAKSLVEFVELCERKEREMGEPCTIIASY